LVKKAQVDSETFKTKKMAEMAKSGTHELLITNKKHLIIFIVEIVKIEIQVLVQTSFLKK